MPTTIEGKEPKELVAPTFVRTLEEIRISEGEPVEFECVIVGEPMPQIKWYKDSGEIKANDSHYRQTLKSDGTARLTLSSAEMAHAGLFR